ncbi:MAG: hypothetical protein ABIB47_05670 [Candidatus Woesearchaeota archaeon]
MVNVEVRENKDLKLDVSLFGRLFNKEFPDFRKIPQETIASSTDNITLEYKIDFPVPQIGGTSTYTVISIEVGDYKYLGWKEFGPNKGNWLSAKFSMRQASQYVKNLKTVLESL